MSDNHRKNKKAHWVMAYICMPLLLSIISGIIIIFGFSPLENSFSQKVLRLVHSGDSYFVSDVQSIFKEAESNEPEKIPFSGKKQVIEEPNIGDQYGTLTCERLGINSAVLFGDNREVLKYGIGTYPASWIPGCGKTTLMSAHNDLDFAPLADVEIGDKFVLTTDYGTFEYVVSEYTIVNETQKDACRLDSETEQVVLYTCYPFYRISGRREERFFVYLEKVSGTEIELINYFLKD